MAEAFEFLPVSKEDMVERGWYYYDFLLITGDAYVDHPSFGTAVISRVLEKVGFRVAILSQPDYHSADELRPWAGPAMPPWSMRATSIPWWPITPSPAETPHAKRTPTPPRDGAGKPAQTGRSSSTPAWTSRATGPDLPIVIGGIRGVACAGSPTTITGMMRSAAPILVDSAADLLILRHGGAPDRRDRGPPGWRGAHPQHDRHARGTCYLTRNNGECALPAAASRARLFSVVSRDKRDSLPRRRRNPARTNQDDVTGAGPFCKRQGDRYAGAEPARQAAVHRRELDEVHAMPYHPDGIIPLMRQRAACPPFGKWSFPSSTTGAALGAATSAPSPCTRAAMSPRRSRRIRCCKRQSAMTHAPAFQRDISTMWAAPRPTSARPACSKQMTKWMCLCGSGTALRPSPCPALQVDHQRLSGPAAASVRALARREKSVHPLRHPLRLHGAGPSRRRFSKSWCAIPHQRPAQSGPEHMQRPMCCYYMGKPPKLKSMSGFCEKYKRLNQKYGLEQYLVPYLMSSHPGSTAGRRRLTWPQYLNATGHAGPSRCRISTPRRARFPPPCTTQGWTLAPWSRVRGQRSPRKGHAAGAAPMEEPQEPGFGAGSPSPGRAGRL